MRVFFVFLLFNTLLTHHFAFGDEINKGITESNHYADIQFTIKPDFAKNLIKFQITDSDLSKNLINIEFDIEKNYYVYANDSGELGYPFTISAINSEDLIKVTYPKHKQVKEFLDEKEATFNIYEGKNNAQAQIKGEQLLVDFLLCGNDKCIPTQASFALHFDNAKNNSAKREQNISSQNTSLFKAIIIAFISAILGGFALNFMPCVLPVLSLKLTSIIEEKEDVTGRMISISLGILTTFLSLAAIVIIAQNAGNAIGWGTHFQNKYFLITLFILMILISDNLWGHFEISLPSNMLSSISRVSSRYKGRAGSYFLGLISTVMATPCTAPFLSTSVAFAIAQKNQLIILLIYIGLAIGMSFPYIAVGIFPKAVAFIPKPGPWMMKLKKFFAICVLTTAIWVLYILRAHLSWKSIVILVSIVVFIRMLLQHTSAKKIIKIFRGLSLVLLIMLAFYLPNKFEMQDQEADQMLSMYWEKFDEVKLHEYISKGNIIFLDITADWCITCKYNKFMILSDTKLLDFLKANHVILMQANYTKRSVAIQEFIMKQERHGIPINIVYGPLAPKNGILLSEIFDRDAIMNALFEAGLRIKK
ncbi:MAG: thioredoxin family protein [Proteobacteria bacterium]|nr:thioredoxin family protein [Pseudomonadota bacterium]